MEQKGHTWSQYVKNIIATDFLSAAFLATWLRNLAINKDHAVYLEVIDLQQYKVIRQPSKIKAAIPDRSKIPFVFVVGKN